MENKTIDFFHVGPQKTGTTWVYQCLKEHPEVLCPCKDRTHFFSMHFHRGREWLCRYFDDESGKLVFDPTPNYFRSPFAPKRIFEENPKAKIIMCLRQPIERAFSHYWHEKKKMRFNFKFEEVLTNFDLFTNWIEPSLYSVHIERYFKYFAREQILIQFFDDLQKDPKSFLKTLLSFIGIDTQFQPTVIYRKINVASPRQLPLSNRGRQAVSDTMKKIRIYELAKRFKQILTIPIEKKFDFTKRIEMIKDVNPSVIEELDKLFIEDIDRLEALLNVKLSLWRNKRYR